MATYYVATDGSDGNDGSIGSPWATIQHAIDNSGAGDTVNLREGTYTESYITLDGNSGEGGDSGSWWTLQSYTGETATVQAPLYFLRAEYVRIQNIHLIRQSGYFSIALKGEYSPWCSYFEILNNTITGNNYNLSAINLVGNNITVQDNTINLTDDGSTYDHGIYVSAGDSYLIKGNTITNAAQFGIHVFNQARAWGNHNITNVIIENNIVKNAKVSAGILVWAGDPISIDEVMIRNNVVTGSGKYGVYVKDATSGTVTNIDIYNNTLHENTLGEIRIDGSGVNYVDIRNNILSDSDGYHINCLNSPGNVTADYNLYSVTANNSGISAGANKVEGNPLFSNAAANDFTLQSASPAIDAGTTIAAVTGDKDGTSRPQGAAYDIGAYEYVPGGGGGGEPSGNQWAADADIIAVWNFESGELTTDSKGSNTLTSYNSPDSDTSIYKQGSGSVDLDFYDADYFAITDASLDADFPGKNTNSNDEFSHCFWIYLKTAGTKYGVMTKGTLSGSDVSYSIEKSTADKFEFIIGYNSGASEESIPTSNVIQASRWYHVGWSCNAADKSHIIRVWDDTDQAIHENITGTSTNAWGGGSTGTFSLGANPGGGNPTNIKFDEYVSVNRKLTADEIDEIRQGVYGAINIAAAIHQYSRRR